MAFRASSTAIGNNFALTIAKPAGVVSGDLMLAVIGIKPAFGINSAPAGWTMLDYVSGTNHLCAVFWKLASASEPANYAWGIGQNSWDEGSGLIVVYSGCDQTTPIEAFTKYSTTHNDFRALSVTTLTAGATLVALSGSGEWGYSNSTTTVPSGYTQRAQVLTVENGGAQAADKVQVSAGASGDAFFTTTGAYFVGAFHLALRAAGGSSEISATSAKSYAGLTGSGGVQVAVAAQSAKLLNGMAGGVTIQVPVLVQSANALAGLAGANQAQVAVAAQSSKALGALAGSGLLALGSGPLTASSTTEIGELAGAAAAKIQVAAMSGLDLGALAGEAAVVAAIGAQATQLFGLLSGAGAVHVAVAAQSGKMLGALAGAGAIGIEGLPLDAQSVHALGGLAGVGVVQVLVLTQSMRVLSVLSGAGSLAVTDADGRMAVSTATFGGMAGGGKIVAMWLATRGRVRGPGSSGTILGSGKPGKVRGL